MDSTLDKSYYSSALKNFIFKLVSDYYFALTWQVTFAGISSRRSSSLSFQGSPVSAEATEGGLISVQFYPNPSASTPQGPGFESPKYVVGS